MIVSGVERERLRRGRETWLPMGFVLLALAFAIVLPRIADRRVARLRNEINDLATPARLSVAEVQLQLAVAAAQLRGFLLSGDSVVGDQVAASLARRRAAEQRLGALVLRLSEPTDMQNAVTRLVSQTRKLDSLIVADFNRPVSSESVQEQRRLFLAIGALGDSIGTRVDSAAAARRSAIGETENMVRLLTALSLVLGFVAAVAVARLGGKFRVMALRLDESEREARETARREHEARTELERVTGSRERLLRGFTHDIKNPLGAADGFLVLVQERVYGELPPKVADAIRRVRKSIGQALELIGRLLDIARAEAGQLEIRPTRVDVGELVREIAEAFGAQAAAKQITLTASPPSEPFHVQTDATRVRQVVGNLVSNAVKYTPAGGHVAVSAGLVAQEELSGRQVALIRVTDDGPGISAEKQPLLFREFTRFDPQAAEGAGVGLAISQKIAEALGGAILVESSEKGSTFTLRLPLGDRRAGNEASN